MSYVMARQANDFESKVVPPIVFAPGSRLADVERILILETMRFKGMSRKDTAATLGIGIRTLQRKLKEYGVPLVNMHA